MNKKKAIIIGAGPAGLTAAYELLKKTDIVPIIYEKTNTIGGISKTINYKGNRIDLGGHRFFSKSDQIMKWWLNILPLQSAPAKDDILLNRQFNKFLDYFKKYSNKNHENQDPEMVDEVMLVRNRVSRILFSRKFFDYPISLNFDTFMNLGLEKSLKIFFSYIKYVMFPINEEKSLEDFFINRFGKELYLTFFKDYTEKVWGIPCTEIKPEWGSQRIKNLSITKTILHALRKLLAKDNSNKMIETSLIESFMYPKFGPGQMWEQVAKKIIEKGGRIFLNHKVIGINFRNNEVCSAKIEDKDGNIFTQNGDFFFSSMPIKNLIKFMGPNIPESVIKVANGLIYRDFITVGLLIDDLKIKNESNFKSLYNRIPDNWIYVQEKDVKLGRIQLFNNWSPYLVKDDEKIWLGLEYFCNRGDNLWEKTDKDMIDFASDELVKIGFIDHENNILDATVIKMEKAYPAYFGSYDKFEVIKKYLDNFKNLFLIGRNGMHRYNNMDHSMMTAIKAVENIIYNRTSNDNIWMVNTEDEYHE